MITDSYYKLKQASHYFSDEEQDEKHVLRYTAEFDFTSGVSLIRILKSSPCVFRPFISTDEQCNNKNNKNNNKNNKSVGFLLRTSHVLLPLSPILPYDYSLRRWLRYQESVSQWYSLLLFQCFLLSFLLTYLYYIYSAWH